MTNAPPTRPARRAYPGRPITEADLLAYVDDQLSPRRRGEVEAYLADHPAAARRIAADLAVMDGLRRLFGRQPSRGQAVRQCGRGISGKL